MADNQGDVEAGNGEDQPLSGGANRLEDVKENPFIEKVFAGIACVAVLSSVLQIALYFSNPLVIAAGVGSAGLAPYAYFQQIKLTDIASLKETHEALQREVDTLKEENNRLRKGVDDLGDTVKRLGDVEDALDVITQTQGQSVEAFEEQVAENRAILNEMEKNLQANILQNLFSVVMGSDQDGDLLIDDEELEEVCRKMDQIKGVKVNKELFCKAIKSNGSSLDAVMKIVKRLITEGGDGRPEEEQIFVLTEV